MQQPIRLPPLSLSLSSLPQLQPTLSQSSVHPKQEMSKPIYLKRAYDGYSVYTFESASLGTTHVMERDCGDYYEVTPFKGIIANEPQFVMAAGGIPDELGSKFDDGDVSFTFPITPMKFPKVPGDPIERRKVWDKVEEEGVKLNRAVSEQAYYKAMARLLTYKLFVGNGFDFF